MIRGGDFTSVLESPLKDLIEEAFKIDNYKLLRPVLYNKDGGKYEIWRLVLTNDHDEEIEFSKQLLSSLDKEVKLEEFTIHIGNELIERNILTREYMQVSKTREDEFENQRVLQRPRGRKDS